tara:strand:+ start:11 stop:1303 length:1293 start_codon:yes stop_codon:yes gene_type:complete
MNIKLPYKFLRKINNLLFILLGSFLIILYVKYSQFTIEKKQNELIRTFENKHFKTTKDFILNKIKSNYLNIEHKIKSGENFNNILSKYKIPDTEIKNISAELEKFTKLNSLKIGSLVTFSIREGKKRSIETLKFPVSNTINLLVKRDYDDAFTVEKIVTKLFKKNILKENIILTSLYKSAIEKKIHPNIIIEFARIYGFEIDFQRDIRKNDTFQILYEVFTDEYGEFYKTGKIIFARMNVQNKEISLYRFDDNKYEGYYNVNGKSVEKALMKTPINGARLSSSFGLRKHPILGYNKMHRGTDFAAPLGTPIMASGTGTIVFAKWCGGGGNCIKIKHNSTYSTVYAHMSKFAKGMKSGKKVKQGQIIGYVGSTGLSTGPHLHYEVHVNGKKVNSQKLKLPSGKTLKGKDREKFEVQRIKIDVKLSEMIDKS